MANTRSTLGSAQRCKAFSEMKLFVNKIFIHHSGSGAFRSGLFVIFILMSDMMFLELFVHISKKFDRIGLESEEYNQERSEWVKNIDWHILLHEIFLYYCNLKNFETGMLKKPRAFSTLRPNKGKTSRNVMPLHIINLL